MILLFAVLVALGAIAVVAVYYAQTPGRHGWRMPSERQVHPPIAGNPAVVDAVCVPLEGEATQLSPPSSGHYSGDDLALSQEFNNEPALVRRYMRPEYAWYKPSLADERTVILNRVDCADWFNANSVMSRNKMDGVVSHDSDNIVRPGLSIIEGESVMHINASLEESGVLFNAA